MQTIVILRKWHNSQSIKRKNHKTHHSLIQLPISNFYSSTSSVPVHRTNIIFFPNEEYHRQCSRHFSWFSLNLRQTPTINYCARSRDLSMELASLFPAKLIYITEASRRGEVNASKSIHKVPVPRKFSVARSERYKQWERLPGIRFVRDITNSPGTFSSYLRSPSFLRRRYTDVEQLPTGGLESLSAFLCVLSLLPGGWSYRGFAHSVLCSFGNDIFVARRTVLLTVSACGFPVIHYYPILAMPARQFQENNRSFLYDIIYVSQYRFSAIFPNCRWKSKRERGTLGILDDVRSLR